MSHPTVPELIEHARRFMSDPIMVRDWRDCVMVLYSPDSKAHERLADYYQARKSAPGWSPGDWRHNNHDRIPAPRLAAILGQVRVCVECGRPFESANKRQRFCTSTGCRRNRDRSLKRANYRKGYPTGQNGEEKPQVSGLQTPPRT